MIFFKHVPIKIWLPTCNAQYDIFCETSRFIVLYTTASKMYSWTISQSPPTTRWLCRVAQRRHQLHSQIPLSRAPPGGLAPRRGKERETERLRNTRRNRIRAEQRWVGLENGEQDLGDTSKIFTFWVAARWQTNTALSALRVNCSVRVDTFVVVHTDE